jgi:hypothetical protein
VTRTHEGPYGLPKGSPRFGVEGAHQCASRELREKVGLEFAFASWTPYVQMGAHSFYIGILPLEAIMPSPWMMWLEPWNVDTNSNDLNGSLKRLLSPQPGILPAVQEFMRGNPQRIVQGYNLNSTALWENGWEMLN